LTRRGALPALKQVQRQAAEKNVRSNAPVFLALPRPEANPACHGRLRVSTHRQCEGKRTAIERLDRFNPRRGGWREVLVEDRTAGPAEIAMTRLDFASWLSTLSKRDRQLAEKLVLGETTGRVARTFRISAARVSQLRRELCASWHRFVGELTDAALPSVATA
jgi:hypothetical protein